MCGVCCLECYLWQCKNTVLHNQTDRQIHGQADRRDCGSVQRFGLLLVSSSSTSLSLFFDGFGRHSTTISSSLGTLSIIVKPSSLSTSKSPEESALPIPDCASFSFSACWGRERGSQGKEERERAREREREREREGVWERERERERERKENGERDLKRGAKQLKVIKVCKTTRYWMN